MNSEQNEYLYYLIVEKMREKIEQLRRQINEHNYRYYVLNDPLIGDYEFDALVIDDRKIRQPVPKDPRNRLERVIYGDDCRVVVDKYIQGRQIPLS